MTILTTRRRGEAHHSDLLLVRRGVDDQAMQEMVFLSEEHDHAHCVDEALAQAEQICTERGARLTQLRRQVLRIVWASHRPIGAYDVLQRLTHEGRRAAPPTVSFTHRTRPKSRMTPSASLCAQQGPHPLSSRSVVIWDS